MKSREAMMEKVEKLLALSESPVEFEAQSALLTARKIMAKYKIEMRELNLSKKQEVKWSHTSVKFSGRRDPWIKNMGAVIAKNMCCRFVMNQESYRSQTYGCTFVGLEEDVEVCVKAFNYAVTFVQSHLDTDIDKPMRKQLKVDYRTKLINGYCNSYGYGFVRGLEDAFEYQYKDAINKDISYAMVMVVPDEVNDEIAKKTRIGSASNYSAQHRLDFETYNQGKADGKQFDVNRKFVEAC